MQTALTFVAFFALAYGQPKAAYYYAVPKLPLHTPILLTSHHDNGVQAQYHAQDAFGQYSYGYTEPLSTKQEVRDLNGATRGTYSYIDAAGKIQTVDYTADASGFHVKATNLPQAPVATALKPNEETAEVAELRAQHLAAHMQAKLRLAGDTTILPNLPRPVEDTPEVAAAKIEFFKRFEEEKLRHKLLRQKQQIYPIATVPAPAPAPAPAATTDFAYLYKLPIAVLPHRYYLPVA